MRAIRMATWGVAAVLAAFLAYSFLVTGRDTPLPAIEVGGDFRLVSSKGGVVDSRDLRGQPYAIFFGFTHCPEVCPTTLYEMSTVLGALDGKASGFRVFFVTVDPERDTVEKMRDYIGNFDPRMEALVPTPDQLQKIAKDFRIYFAKVPTSDGSYTMDHTATVFLMDAQGRLVSTIAYGEKRETREAKLRKLLGL